jgi:protocatechuate 3,4-dioxygenase beta subunit
MDRRHFIVGAGGLILSGVTSRVFGNSKQGPAYPSRECRAVPHVTPGPFIKPDSPLRSDIREGLPGAPLKLKLRLVDDVWCQPVEGAVVDAWQCDAIGRYSGVENINFDLDTLRVTGVGLDMRGEDFLRGHQVTGQDGVAEFTTLYPGWYVPRLPHLHLKITYRDIDWTTTSTQLFFPAAVERAVFESEPYASRGPNPIDLNRDIVLKGDQKRLDALTVDLQKDSDGFAGTFDIAISAL